MSKPSDDSWANSPDEAQLSPVSHDLFDPDITFEEIERKLVAGEYPEAFVPDLLYLMDRVMDLDMQLVMVENYGEFLED